MKPANLTLDLRSYSPEQESHRHDYHQLVLPVDGTLKLTIDGGYVDDHLAELSRDEDLSRYIL